MKHAAEGVRLSGIAQVADDPWINWLLDTARNRLGTTIAWISEFTEDSQLLHAVTGDLDAMNVSVGMAAPLEGSFCVRVLSGQLPPVVTAADRDARTRDLPVTAQLGIGSYVGAPIRSPGGGRPVGMLCCLGRGDGAQLDPEAARFLAFLADLVSHHLTWEPQADADQPSESAVRLDRVLRDGLQLVFQPIVEMCTGRPVGYEALSRFVGADTATVFSDAARTGRGIELERRALRAALDATRQRGVLIGVNLSPQALLHEDVVEMLVAHRGGRIAVEITEHSPIEDYAPLLEVRTVLREAGVHVSVDDAGAGYSSLRHVLLLRPDSIKIDAAVISGIDADPAKQALVTGIKTFAAEIGAAVIAEGIETEAERAALADRGVPYGQGWLWGKPHSFPDTAAIAHSRST